MKSIVRVVAYFLLGAASVTSKAVTDTNALNIRSLGGLGDSPNRIGGQSILPIIINNWQKEIEAQDRGTSWSFVYYLNFFGVALNCAFPL